ncbi:unnamed protein product [Pocillopora meandrina]|uniref:phosphoethanolamine N-methyltransferase n=1 Tax=Pocillopora meandrina TaxID=46732 RepID=A0AAU9VYG3_9CNID|nr:unnamed protein product [Pocillopora meandrina]
MYCSSLVFGILVAISLAWLFGTQKDKELLIKMATLVESNQTRDQMTEFWNKHSMAQSVEEMMLDSKAETLTQDEHPEVMGMLPNIKGNDVLELGAGIGRFTGDIAQEARHVTAVDFMQSFTDKNKEVNGAKFNNIDFVCADVTKLELPKGSYDVIFSNWLLMYLSDEELEKLAMNMLLWLRDGGHLFFRESCYHSSGDMKNSENPTVYRTPQMYTEVFSAVKVKLPNGNSSSLEVVTKRSVEAYAKHKQNKHQFSWLWKKVMLKNGSKGNMQEFLDNNQYNKAGILMYERVFGKGFVSPGGMTTMKEFVGRLNLQKDQHILDLGCGIGGSAFYIANTYHAHVLGMDLSTNMINFALKAYESSKSSQVQFEVSDASTREFPAERFDAVYSRETILHIKDKKALLKKILSWLKPGGQLLITDYCCSRGEHSELFKKYLAERQYHLIDVESYGKMLREVGFEAVTAEDRTTQFTQILESELKNFEKSKEEFIKDFSSEDYSSLVNSWTNKLTRCRGGEHTWGVFYARKPVTS